MSDIGSRRPDRPGEGPTFLRSLRSGPREGPISTRTRQFRRSPRSGVPTEPGWPGPTVPWSEPLPTLSLPISHIVVNATKGEKPLVKGKNETSCTHRVLMPSREPASGLKRACPARSLGLPRADSASTSCLLRRLTPSGGCGSCLKQTTQPTFDLLSEDDPSRLTGDRTKYRDCRGHFGP